MLTDPCCGRKQPWEIFTRQNEIDKKSVFFLCCFIPRLLFISHSNKIDLEAVQSQLLNSLIGRLYISKRNPILWARIDGVSRASVWTGIGKAVWNQPALNDYWSFCIHWQKQQPQVHTPIVRKRMRCLTTLIKVNSLQKSIIKCNDQKSTRQ